MRELIVDGREFGSVAMDFLSERLAALASVERAEVWLSNVNGRSLCLLKAGDRALLMILLGDVESSITSRATDVQAPDAATQFTLANGQIDEYPTAWTIPFEEARRAVEQFWFEGAPAPSVTWSDDAG